MCTTREPSRSSKIRRRLLRLPIPNSGCLKREGIGPCLTLVVRFTNNVAVRPDFCYREVKPQKSPARKGSRYARSHARSMYLPRPLFARGTRHDSPSHRCGSRRSAMSIGAAPPSETRPPKRGRSRGRWAFLTASPTLAKSMARRRLLHRRPTGTRAQTRFFPLAIEPRFTPSRVNGSPRPANH